MSIPFETLAQRHLVYAYCVVWLLQFGYASSIILRWFRERRS